MNKTLLGFCLIGGISLYTSFSVFAQQNIRHFLNGTVESPKENPFDNQAHKVVNCVNQNTYRSIDGSCNNTSNSDWGAVNVPFQRAIPSDYNGTVMAGPNRMNPRAISNRVYVENFGKHSDDLSAFVFSWGQFLDHDITRTNESSDPADIAMIMPTNEPNDIITVPISFHRSAPFPGTGVAGVDREQFNSTTAWIDASQIYGDNAATNDWLRTYVDGKLWMTNDGLLPYNTINKEVDGAIDPNAPVMQNNLNVNPHFISGDLRANEQTGLIALHVLFSREHNRICDEFIATGLTDDETIYQEAKKKVSAMIQQISFGEFLPSLGIVLDPYNGYNSNLQPDLMNVFSTAAFRIGHTMVDNILLMKNQSGNSVGPGWLMLRQSFFNPQWVENYGIEPFFSGMAQMFQRDVDSKIVEELRSFLFTDELAGPGFDLAALNIQRGRDHGLDDYNAFRTHFTGAPALTYEDINADLLVQSELQAAYPDINDIDVWVGLLAEEKIPDGQMGLTVSNILKQQFQNLRDADYYYFENDPSFSPSDIMEIKNTSLADIIKRNTEINYIQDNVFYQQRVGACGIDYATLHIDRNGALYAIPDFSLNGNETYTWFDIDGNQVAEFTGNPYYSPTEVGTYFLVVTDPDSECSQTFGPRTITSLDGCCELDD